MTDADPFALEALAIDKRFGPAIVPKAADLKVRTGEIHASLGGDGAGESTMIRIISGGPKAGAGALSEQRRSRPSPS